MAYTTINKGTDYFQTKIYTGNATTNAITGVGFQPDLVWAKKRTTGNEHTLADVVRGSNKVVYTNLTNAEGDKLTSGITSFDTDGFTIGGASGDYNDTGVGYASWNWLAGGTGVSNTDGDVTATVSANQTSGFSIVKYTNPASGSPFTVGHGLGSAPKMIINKSLSASNWTIWHNSLGFGQWLKFDTSASSSANFVTATSSTTYSSYYDHYGAGQELISYCFADVKGFSKFGSYTGNGNNDGVFVYTGFKPAFIITKSTGVGVWNLLDNKRNGYNVTHLNLQPHNSNGEDTGRDIDFLSNGFKLRNGGTEMNASGVTYMYMCFAEHPLVSSTGTPCTAR